MHLKYNFITESWAYNLVLPEHPDFSDREGKYNEASLQVMIGFSRGFICKFKDIIRLNVTKDLIWYLWASHWGEDLMVKTLQKGRKPFDPGAIAVPQERVRPTV